MNGKDEIISIFIVCIIASVVLGIDHFISHQAIPPVNLSMPLLTQASATEAKNIEKFLAGIEFDSAQTANYIQKKESAKNLHAFYSLCKSVNKANALLKGNAISSKDKEEITVKFKWIVEGRGNTYSFLNAEQKTEIGYYYELMLGLEKFGTLEKWDKELRTTKTAEKVSQINDFLNRHKNQ